VSAHRHQATWRSLIFNRRYLDVGADPDDVANIDSAYTHSDYTLDSFDPTPLSMADLREARQFLEGAEPNQAFEGVRLLGLRGRIVASTHADLEDKTWAMYEAFSPAACRMAFVANDPPHVGPFDFKRDSVAGTLALRFYARPGIGRPVVFGRRQEGNVRPYVARLIAYDPKAYAVAELSTALGNLAGGANTVSNPGNLPTDPKIEIVLSAAGHATFTIANQTTGHTIVFDLDAETAGTFTLDVGRATFAKAGVNKLALRVSGYPVNQFLAAGDNTIVVTNATSVTSVTFKRRAAYA